MKKFCKIDLSDKLNKESSQYLIVKRIYPNFYHFNNQQFDKFTLLINFLLNLLNTKIYQQKVYKMVKYKLISKCYLYKIELFKGNINWYEYLMNNFSLSNYKNRIISLIRFILYYTKILLDFNKIHFNYINLYFKNNFHNIYDYPLANVTDIKITIDNVPRKIYEYEKMLYILFFKKHKNKYKILGKYYEMINFIFTDLKDIYGKNINLVHTDLGYRNIFFLKKNNTFLISDYGDSIKFLDLYYLIARIFLDLNPLIIFLQWDIIDEKLSKHIYNRFYKNEFFYLLKELFKIYINYIPEELNINKNIIMKYMHLDFLRRVDYLIKRNKFDERIEYFDTFYKIFFNIK